MSPSQREASPVTAVDEYTSQWTETVQNIKSQYADTKKIAVSSFEQEKTELVENVLRELEATLENMQETHDDALSELLRLRNISLAKHFRTADQFPFSLIDGPIETPNEDIPPEQPVEQDPGEEQVPEESSPGSEARPQSAAPTEPVQKSFKQNNAKKRPRLRRRTNANHIDSRNYETLAAQSESDTPRLRKSRRRRANVDRTGSRGHESSAAHSELDASGRRQSRRRRAPTAKLRETRDKPPPRGPGLGPSKTIDFDDVFQDGRAEQKHMIISWPKGSNQWFILYCEEHGLAFGRNPLLGASRHIGSEDHQHLPEDYDFAVKILGVQVLNCDLEKANRNNAIYKANPINYRLSRPNPLETGESPSPSPERQRSPSPMQDDVQDELQDELQEDIQEDIQEDNGITDAVVGEVYRAYWKPSKSWYAAVVLPIGKFESVTLRGSILETGLVKHIPVCYRSDSRTKAIMGWAQDYQDGGPKVKNRKFPVMYFDEGLEIPSKGELTIPDKNLLSWVSAKNLMSLDLQDPESRLVQGFQSALDYVARLKTIRDRGSQQGESSNDDSTGSADSAGSDDSTGGVDSTGSVDTSHEESVMDMEVPDHDSDEDYTMEHEAGGSPFSDIRLRSFGEILSPSEASADVDRQRDSQRGSPSLGFVNSDLELEDDAASNHDEHFDSNPVTNHLSEAFSSTLAEAPEPSGDELFEEQNNDKIGEGSNINGSAPMAPETPDIPFTAPTSADPTYLDNAVPEIQRQSPNIDTDLIRDPNTTRHEHTASAPDQYLAQTALSVLHLQQLASTQDGRPHDEQQNGPMHPPAAPREEVSVPKTNIDYILGQNPFASMAAGLPNSRQTQAADVTHTTVDNTESREFVPTVHANDDVAVNQESRHQHDPSTHFHPRDFLVNQQYEMPTNNVQRSPLFSTTASGSYNEARAAHARTGHWNPINILNAQTEAIDEGHIVKNGAAQTNVVPKKRKFTRTKQGCLTCRSRGKKCDEVKPYCESAVFLNAQ